MAIVDERGRLWGRLNLIDLAAGICCLILVVLAYGAYQLFRTPVPEMLSIEPAHLEQGKNLRVTLRGKNLRPYLRASVGAAACPGFLVESPTAAEIKLPDLTPGTYDLVLNDESREVARRQNALTIVPLRRRNAAVVVRFVTMPDTVSQLTPGALDVDRRFSTPEGQSAAATLVAFTKVRDFDSRVSMAPSGLDATGAVKVHDVPQRLTIVDATFNVPVEKVPDGWQYKGAVVKAGMAFGFDSSLYLLRGWIVRVEIPEADGTDTDRLTPR